MTEPRDRSRGGWPSPGRPDEDSWGPSTAVYSGAARPADPRLARPFPPAPHPFAPDQGSAPRPTTSARPPVTGRAAAAPRSSATEEHDDDWTPAGPASRDRQRANRLMERELSRAQQPAAPERGVSWWVALLVLVVIAIIGGLIDTVGSNQVRGGFNIGIVVASIVAILLVRRSHMFPVVIAPPIVYSLAAVFQLYLRSSGLHDKKVVLDAAANYLVYGFPAIAAATAAVLIIAGVRLIARR